METRVAADRDAEVEAVLLAPGDRVQAKDLLIVLNRCLRSPATPDAATEAA